MNTPISSGPPSPKPKRYTHTPRSKSLTLRASPKRELSSEFMLTPTQSDDKDTAATESITSPVKSDQTNTEESDPNSASIIASPTQSVENHESIEQAIKTLEETIKLDQHEHALRILSRQSQQPEYKGEKSEFDNSTATATVKKSSRSSTAPVKSFERKMSSSSILKQQRSYSYGSPQKSQPINDEPRKLSVPSLKPKNLCTCGDSDSFWCQVCENRRFKSSFPKWTSGNKVIDTFIQESQLTTAGPFNYIEWIPFDRFRNVKIIGEGGYGTVSTATWLDGPRILRDDKMQTKWKRDARKRVILKHLHNSEHITNITNNEVIVKYI
jgi:hypothetical protein